MKKFKFWCKGTSTNKNFNKPGWWAYPNYLLNKYFYGLDIFESPDFEVCQWTGLVDKNGVEIYEGDILLSQADDCYLLVKLGWYRQLEELSLPDGRVHTFNYSHMGFFVEGSAYKEEFEGTLAITNSNSIVVGNKFENPELLAK